MGSLRLDRRSVQAIFVCTCTIKGKIALFESLELLVALEVLRDKVTALCLVLSKKACRIIIFWKKDEISMAFSLFPD